MTTYTQVFGNNTIPPSQYAFSEVSLVADASLNWPENSTGNSLIAPLMEVTATSGPWSLTLPSAAEVSEGRDFVVRNIGSNSFYVKNASGTTLATVAAGEAKYFYLTSNSSVAGTWSVFTYGTGTSSADASALVGNGLRVSLGKLATVFYPDNHSTDYTILTTDVSKLLKFTGGSNTWTLPDVSSMNDGEFFLISNSGTGTLTLDASTGSGAIDGETTKQIQPGESVIVVIGSGNDWVTIGYGRSTEFQFTQLTVDVSTGGTSDINISSTQATNKLIYFTGTASGNRNVVFPAVSSIYFMKVGSIGASNQLTITTGSGTTVPLLSNQSYVVYCDGANISYGQTVSSVTTLALADGTAGTPSISFNDDPDTGLYSPSTDSIGITVGGLAKLTISPTGISFLNDLNINGLHLGSRGASSNTIFGESAMSATEGATHSTAVGGDALNALTTGNYNTAVGHASLGSMTVGYYNTAFGANALGLNSAGSNNTAVGPSSGYYLVGSYNTYIGGYDGNSGGYDLRALNNHVVISDGAANLRAIWNASGNLNQVSAGTAALPSLYFNGDLNTGIYSPGADQIGISTGGSARMTINSSGLITIAQGQIKFPATQNASSDANTLDDYEEGTWTPFLWFQTPGTSSFTYDGAATTGKYVKIGKQVTLIFNIKLTGYSAGTASGYLLIGGFSSAGTLGSQRASGSVGYAYGAATYYPNALISESGGAAIYPVTTQPTGATMYQGPTNVTATYELYGTITYFT